MIYSRFGTVLTLLSKVRQDDGQVAVQASALGTPVIRDYRLGDMMADEGATEIDAAIAGLPWRVIQKKAKRSVRGV